MKETVSHHTVGGKHMNLVIKVSRFDSQSGILLRKYVDALSLSSLHSTGIAGHVTCRVGIVSFYKLARMRLFFHLNELEIMVIPCLVTSTTENDRGKTICH